MKTLLTGKRYVSAAKTDLRRTFARLRREQREAELSRKLAEEVAMANVKQIPKKVKA